MKRLFIAIKILPDENMLKNYCSLRESLRNNNIRWVEPDKFHLTIKFLGDTSDDAIVDVNNVIIDSLESKSSFNIELKNTEIFGSRYDPRVIWYGIEENSNLQDLSNDVINKLHNIGFLKDRQNFVPHLTIGRIKEIEDKKIFNNVINNYRNIYLQKSLVHKVELFESILTRQGPIYNVIESYILGNNELYN